MDEEKLIKFGCVSLGAHNSFYGGCFMNFDAMLFGTSIFIKARFIVYGTLIIEKWPS